MSKASVRGFIFFVLLICYGCGTGMIYKTSQNDMQPMTFEEARKKAVSLFWEEGGLSVGHLQIWEWELKSFKVNEDGFTVVYGKDNSLTCDFEFISDPVVNDWGPLANFHYAVELRGGGNVDFWFNKKESAITFAKAFYTLKYRSTEARMAKKQAVQSQAISKEDLTTIVPQAAVTTAARGPRKGAKPESVKTDLDKPVFSPREIIMDENDLAVVIGIEKYQNLPKSDYSKNDAGIVRNYIKALGFQERNIEFITDERATKSSIAKSIEAWLPNKLKKGGKVFVYYSGHGSPNPVTGEAFLVPYDGDPNYLDVTGYPLKRLYEKLGRLQASEVIVVLDSCFSGAGGRSVLAKGARPLVMTSQSVVLPQNMVVLSATQSSQISTSSQEKGYGIFTYYFLKVLKGGNKSVSEIYEYVKPYVEDEAKSINVRQSPSINPNLDKLKGRFLLRK